VEISSFTVVDSVAVTSPWEISYYDNHVYVASVNSVVKISVSPLAVITWVVVTGIWVSVKNIIAHEWFVYITDTRNSSPATLRRLDVSDMTTVVSITWGTSRFAWLAIHDWHIYIGWWSNFLLFKANLDTFTMVSSIGTGNSRVVHLCYWDWFIYFVWENFTTDFGRARVADFSSIAQDYNIYAHGSYPIRYVNWNVYGGWRLVCWWTLKINWNVYTWSKRVSINSDTIEIETVSKKNIWNLSWIPISYTGIF